MKLYYMIHFFMKLFLISVFLRKNENFHKNIEEYMKQFHRNGKIYETFLFLRQKHRNMKQFHLVVNHIV